MQMRVCMCEYTAFIHTHSNETNKLKFISLCVSFCLFFSKYGKVFVCINYTVFPYHTRFLYFLCCEPVESSTFWEMWTWSNQSVQTTTCSLIHAGEWWRGFSTAYAIACDYDLWSELNNWCWMNLPVFLYFYRSLYALWFWHRACKFAWYLVWKKWIAELSRVFFSLNSIYA